MRVMGLALVVSSLVACGSSSPTEVHYDVEAATSCMRHAEPGNTSISRPESLAKGAFGRVFGSDRFDYQAYLLLVAYGPSRSAALRHEKQARAVLRDKYRSLPQAWERRDGNVVYEALGP